MKSRSLSCGVCGRDAVCITTGLLIALHLLLTVFCSSACKTRWPLWSRKHRLEQCVCLERGEDIKGAWICNCECVGGCVPKGQFLGLASAPIFLWTFLTCVNCLQTPRTSPRKLWHPPAAPDLLWLLLSSPGHSSSP